MSKIPMMQEYPEDIPEFPLKKEVEFSIDLILGMGPISIAPYRMSLLELAKLKKLLEELLEKKFVSPNLSSWGAPILFMKKKDENMWLQADY